MFSLSWNWILVLVGVTQTIDQASQPDWGALSKKVHGRLFKGVPFAQPCFDQDFNSSACASVRALYLDPDARSDAWGGYIQTQWETCQTDGQQCLLDYANPHDNTPTLPPNQCQTGSISNHYIDVRTVDDVVAAFEFSKETKIPLVIKNTGHDHKGRSSGPHSLGLWTHNLKDISYNGYFIPEGCTHGRPGMTVGAGVQWGEAYALAEAHNVTVIGGSDASVGVSGGWLQGGGHSPLSNTMGLGVDRVIQFKVVTPDSKYRIANECQNRDLFFALRGGGGGTFGVVLESTMLVSPRVEIQSVTVGFQTNTTLTKELWTILAENGLKWAQDGWGGSSFAQQASMINPKLTRDEAAESLAPLIQFGQRLLREGVAGAHLEITEYSSWGGFFEWFTDNHGVSVGANIALTSRLISKTNFETPSKREELVSGLLATDATTPGIIILLTTPTSYPLTGRTSVTDACRSSLYHVIVVAAGWNWNATKTEKKERYALASRSIDNLRRITPDAAYLNEADVYEPNHKVAFWGDHYPELLRIKEKYDPYHLLDCWQCVGWQPESVRFKCYL